MRIVNLTPHAIALQGTDGTTRIIDRQASAARIETTSGEQVAVVDCVPVHAPSRYVRVINLPPPAEQTIYVVSQLVALAIAAFQPERSDVVYPGASAADRPRRGVRGLIAVSRLIRAV